MLLQGNICNETNLEALLGGSYTHPSQQPPHASPWPNISPALAQRDSLNLSASLPDGISPELRHQAIQKLQQQQQQQLLQQQQDRQLIMGQGKGSGEVALALGPDANGNNSRQSSASMQRLPQSPTLAQTQQQQQRLTASQILYLQQNLQVSGAYLGSCREMLMLHNYLNATQLHLRHLSSNKACKTSVLHNVQRHRDKNTLTACLAACCLVLCCAALRCAVLDILWPAGTAERRHFE